MTKPKLQFAPDGTPTGFSATAIAMFNNLRPARIVREILQNSMDAAVDANEPTAHVRFRVTMAGNENVPDVNGYTKAFREAVQFASEERGGLSTPDQQIVEVIENALDELAANNHHLLAIMDNGVGLDKERMTAILGDAISNKPVEAAGSYGVGHFATVPTSDLRYLLYGGVQSTGRKIAAGCAVLASRPGDELLQSAKGYLIKKFGTGRAGNVYHFIDRADIPSALVDDLQTIRQEWGHGTVIQIPAFNYFRDGSRCLWDTVSKVAAYNFVAAIQDRELVVEVEEDAVYEDEVGVQRLDAETIGEILDKEANRKRAARADSFFAGLRPSGQSAHSIYQVLVRGQRYSIETGFGNATIHILAPSPTGNTRVDLFRNGMWITDDLHGLSRWDFTDRESFHAVLRPASDGDLHHLIRKAEGPMHDELSFKHLDDKVERQNLKDALSAIATFIRNHVPKLGADEYTPDDFLVVETGGEANGGGQRSFSMYGTPVVVERAVLRERVLRRGERGIEHEGNGGGSGRADKRRSSGRGESTSRPLPFQSTVVPDGEGRLVVSLKCVESFQEVALSLRLHENVDATCDRIWPDEMIPVRKFAIEGSKGRTPKATRLPDGIRLEGLVAGETYAITVEHDDPEGLGTFDGGAPLRVVLRQTAPETEEANASQD